VDKVALGQVFFRVLQVFPVSIINLSVWLKSMNLIPDSIIK